MPVRSDSGLSPYRDHVRPLTPDHPNFPSSPPRKRLAAGPEVSEGMMTDTDNKAAPSGPPGPSNLFTNLFKSLTGPQFQLWMQNSSILNSRS